MRPIIQATILVAFMETQIYSTFVWLPSYLHTTLGVDSSDAHLMNVITLGILSLATVAAGYSTRWIDAAKLGLIGILLLVCCSYPLFSLLQHGEFWTLLIVQVMLAIMAAFLLGAIFIILPDLFRANWQTLGMVSTYSFATAVFGGTAPVACAYLIKLTGMPSAPALYITFLGLLAAPVAYGISSQLGVQVVESMTRQNG